MNRKLLTRLFAGLAGLVTAVVLTGCGETGDLGAEGEETTTASPDEGGAGGETTSGAADEGGANEETTAEEGKPDEEATSDAADEGDTSEEATSESADESEASEDTATEESAEDTGDGGDDSGDDSEGEAHTFSGSGLSKSETAHLEGDYTVAFSVSGNTLMDMESNFIGTLTNVDDELDFHLLVNEITTETSGTTNVYGLDGDYYVDVVADGDWSFELTPQ